MPGMPPGNPASSLDILVVDDDQLVREGIADLLTARGHRVRMAGSAREAVTSLESCRIDLVIMDICMPRMDGIELAAMIRMTHPSVYIVLITGGCPDESRIAAQKLRIEGVITKPFRMEAIDATLRRLTGRLATTGKISIPVSE